MLSTSNALKSLDLKSSRERLLLTCQMFTCMDSSQETTRLKIFRRQSRITLSALSERRHLLSFIPASKGHPEGCQMCLMALYCSQICRILTDNSASFLM